MLTPWHANRGVCRLGPFTQSWVNLPMHYSKVVQPMFRRCISQWMSLWAQLLSLLHLTTKPLQPALQRKKWVDNTHLFIGPFSGTTRVSQYQKSKTDLDLLKQETVSGSGISWAICKSAPSSRQITTPAPHHSVFYRPDALPAAQPTASKHWRPKVSEWINVCIFIPFWKVGICYDFWRSLV